MSSFPDTIVIRDPWTGELRTVVVPPVQTFDAPRPCICEGSGRECVEQRRTLASLHTLAVQARDARTSADRRAALDALERAALALGGTP